MGFAASGVQHSALWSQDLQEGKGKRFKQREVAEFLDSTIQ